MIKITKRLNNLGDPTFDIERFDEEKKHYVCLDLLEYLEDTYVGKCYINKIIISEVEQFVNKSLKEDPVPETGGFFLGAYYNMGSEKRLDLIIEKFIPSERVDFRSPTELQFGVNAFHDLDDAVKENNHLVLIGWFHTHPGFGPFLSDMDLNIHEGFFKSSFHIAVVMDPLTKSMECGFFTRKSSNNSVNNEDDYKDSTWISWKSLFESTFPKKDHN